MPNTDIISDVVASEAFKNVIKMQEAMDMLEKKFVSTAQAADIANAAISGSKGIKELQAATANLNTENEQLLKLEKEIANTAAKRAIAESNLGKVLAEEKLMLEQLNKENKNRAKLQLTEAGSLARIDAVILKLQARQRSLNLTTDEGQKKSELYKKSIERLSEARKKDSDIVNQQRLNIGNYQGSAKIIVEALEKEKKKLEELQKIKVQYASSSYKPANTGGASSNTISGGFGFGQGNRSMDQINKEIAESTTKFQALQAIVDKPQFLKVTAGAGDATRQLAFLRKELVNLEVQGLGDSEAAKKLRDSLAELTDQIADAKQEVKALSSDTRGLDLFAGSVSFAADAFQTAAGAAVLFGASEEDAAAATKTLVAIQSVANGVKGIANELTTRGTAANKAFVFVQGLMATATNASATATSRLNAVLKLSTIGVVIALLGAAVYAYNQFNKAGEAAVKSTEDFNKALDENSKALENNINKIDKNTERRKILNKQKFTGDALKELDTEAELAALSEKKLAVQKQINNISSDQNKMIADRAALEKAANDVLKKRSLSDKDVSVLGSTEAKLKSVNDKLAAGNIKYLEYIKQQSDLNTEQTNLRLNQIADTKQAEFKAIEEAQKKASDNAKKSIEDAKKLAEDLAKFNSKLSADEINAKQTANQLKIKQAADTFKRIADNEKASLQDRLLANGFYYGSLEKGIIDNAEFEKQQLINSTVREKEEILKRKLFQSEKAALLQQINGQLVAIEQKTQDEITTIHRDGIANQNKLLEENIATQIELLAKKEGVSIAAINKEESEKLAAIERQYGLGLISKEQYEKDRANIEADYALKRLNIELDTAVQLFEIAKAAGQDVSEQEAKIANLRLQIARNTTAGLKGENDKQAADEKALADQKKALWMELGTTLKNTVFSFIDSGFERQKNTLEKEKNLIDERRDAELARINKLNISEADKADKIKILDANVQAQKEVIARRQKQLDIQKAKADKIKALFDIGISTAVGIIKVAPNPILMALVGAIGALQLAAVIARPIPEYWTGTDDSKGGPVWLGERGKELLITPDNKAYETPGTATLANIPAHSKVINNTEYMRMIRDNEVNTVLKNNRPVDERAFMQWQAKQAEKQTEEIVHAIMNAPQVINKISAYGIESLRRNGHNFQEYIDKKVRFKN